MLPLAGGKMSSRPSDGYSQVESLFFKGGFTQFNIPAFSLSFGLVWSGMILVLATANLIWPGYGRAVLDLAASIYPGYHPGPSIGSIVTGTLYGLVDGTIGGAVFAWLYNFLARRFSGTPG